MNRRFTWVLMGSLVALAVAGLMCVRLRQHRIFSHGQNAHVRVAVPRNVASLLVRLAYRQGFFESSGIDVAIRDVPLAGDAFETLLASKSDIALTSETPVFKEAYRDTRFKILATVYSTSSDVKIIARRDHGIHTAEDLKGKRVGAPGESAPEYYLASFLLQIGLRLEDVDLVHKRPSDLVGDLKKGKIDAVAISEPQAFHVKKGLGKSAIVLPDGALYRDSFALVALNSWVTKNPKVAIAFLQAIHLAEVYAAEHPETVSRILSEELGIEKDSLLQARKDGVSALRLDQSLVTELEERARWMNERHLVPGQKTPNFLSLIYLPALKAVKPEGIGLIH